MNTDALVIGVGGIFMGLVLMYYTLILLEENMLRRRGDVATFLEHDAGLTALKAVSVGFGVYGLSMMVSGLGLFFDVPSIDMASKFLGAASLASMAYFLRAMSKTPR